MYISKNTFNNLDHWSPWANNIAGSFYTIDKMLTRPIIGSLDPEELYVTGIFEYGEVFVHERSVYSLVDCLGDLGGLVEIIYFLTCVMLSPISYHSYILKATSKLFTARTKHDKYFKPIRKVLKGDIEEMQIQLTTLIASHFRPKSLG